MVTKPTTFPFFLLQHDVVSGKRELLAAIGLVESRVPHPAGEAKVLDPPKGRSGLPQD